MLHFCPIDGTMLNIEKGPNGNRFFCPYCPYIFDIKKPIVYTIYPKLKEVGSVMGGEEAWKNVDKTQVTCPKCEHDQAFFKMIQIRSGDEPMTTFFKCCNLSCGHNWKED